MDSGTAVETASSEPKRRGRPPSVNIIETHQTIDVPEAPKRVTMKLERHYCPINAYEIVGHWRPEIKRKHPSGRVDIIQAEEFIPGEPNPGPIPGVGFPKKLWAGTIISIDAEEAKRMRKLGIGSVEIPD